jgi:hypothetical protein
MPPENRERRRRKAGRPWLATLRWTVGALAMIATWGYGAFKGGNALWISIPGGAVMMACTANALTIPVVTAALVSVAFIYGIDSGVVTAIRNAAAALILIGLAMTGWRVVTGLRERDRRRRG